MITIKLDNISYTYPNGVQALSGISAVFHPGETVAVIGTNGAGKTTLARLLKGLIIPSTGRVCVGDWDTSRVSASRLASKIGCVLADPRLQIFTTSVQEEVAFGPSNLRWPAEQIHAAVTEALQAAELQDKASCHPYELGNNERKRLALASVLAMRCPAIILDEPTAGLDMQSYRCLQNVLATLQRLHTTIIIISHDMDFIADHCRRVLALQKGRLIQDGPTDKVLANAAEYGQELPCTVRLCRALQRPDRYASADFLASLQR